MGLFGQYSWLWARLEGRKDGIQDIPGISEQEPAPVERELTCLGQESVSFVEEELAEGKEAATAKLNSSKERLAVVRGKKGEVKQNGQEKEKELDATLREKEACLEETDFGPKEAACVRWAIAVGDGVINAKCFEVLGGTLVENWIAAAGIAIAIPAAGKAAGIFLKRVFSKSGNQAERIAACAIVAVLPSTLLASLSFLRALFFQASDVADLLNLGASSTGLSLAFFGINYGLYAIIILVTVVSHAPKLTAIESRIKRIERSLKKKVKELTILGGQERDEQLQVNLATSKLDSLTDKSYARAVGLHFSMLRRVFQVRKWNLRKRKNAEMPKSFKTIPKLLRIENPFHFFSPFRRSEARTNGGNGVQNNQSDGMSGGASASTGFGSAGGNGKK